MNTTRTTESLIQIPQLWIGLLLILVFWPLNWLLEGLRTHILFFPLWLGYILAVDGLVLWRRGSSLLQRNRWAFVGLFVASAPCWWLFEVLNWRTGNWVYLGDNEVPFLLRVVLKTINFSTVMPAVFGTAELVSNLRLRASLAAVDQDQAHPAGLVRLLHGRGGHADAGAGVAGNLLPSALAIPVLHHCALQCLARLPHAG